jgi:ssDNA-binding Zn-finger/Zn-ribbon topoisomerase 1
MPGEIDYRLARRSLISEFRKGRLAQHEVCDAHPELLRNAQRCSEPSRIRCPICEEHNLVLVTYAFGPRLPASGRCITSKEELRALSKRSGEFACYVVEVCPECRWNHLARTFLLKPAQSA